MLRRRWRAVRDEEVEKAGAGERNATIETEIVEARNDVGEVNGERGRRGFEAG